jgi:glycosyltransferase involved in cell wall biosynthesis
MPSPDVRIHQFHCGSGPADAVTDSLFFVRSILAGWGIASEIFSESADPRFADAVRPLDRLAIGKNDLLLIHHSGGHDALARLAGLDCRKALVYHAITPPRFFAEDDPSHQRSIAGYAQLGELRAIVEAAVAVCDFDADRLRQRGFENVAVIPLLKDFAAFRAAPHARRPYYDEWPVFRLLHVGRLVPHHCQHELIEFVGMTRAIDGIPLELVLIGDTETDPDYVRRLAGRARRLGIARQVRILGRVGEEELRGWYRAATACVSLGEEEGFAMPLAEAMAFDLPVVAHAAPCVAETLSGTGLMIADKEPATIRAALLRLQRDRSFRRDLIRQQRARLLRFGREQVASELARWFFGLGIDAGTANGALRGGDLDRPDPSRIHYVLEGPYETSYSLAAVVRNLAASLDAREGCVGAIEPAEGDEDWSVDAEAAARLPKMFRDLVRPPPLTGESIVTIRNMFPLRPNGMLGDLRLVHLAWEESAIAADLAAMINVHLDGVLAPSEYCKELIRSSGVRLPIAVIGHGLDHSGLVPPAPIDRTVRGQPSPDHPFVFLHISAGVDRKGVEELVTAYCLAFSRRDPVVLVIKTFDNEQNLVDFWVKRLTGGMPAAPVIQVVKDELHPQEIELLYRLADAVVLPTRGEGFNFPAAEALARGLPVIVTRHSGHLDFCNDANSLLVDCRYEVSTSYLHIPNSVWARASLPCLIAAMKTAYNEARIPGTPTHRRALAAPRQVSRLRWSAVAERVDDFARGIGTRPVMTRRLKLAWISPYNSRCAIAVASRHLIAHFDADAFDITILAADEPPLGPDPENVRRVWRRCDGNFAGLRHSLLSGGFDAAHFQHDFGLFDTEGVAALLESLQQAGLDTYLTLHRTAEDPAADRASLLRPLAAALDRCTRLFVPAVDDMNRLKECGVSGNLVLLPPGVSDRPPLCAGAVRVLLGIERFGPVIGSFAFPRSRQGLQSLIHGFALLLRRHPGALLLLIEGEGLEAASPAEHERCRALIDLLGLAAQVRFVAAFADPEEVAFLLGACDAVAYPSQDAGAAARGALGLALAAGRPVALAPLPVFPELSEIVYRLPGSGAIDIAEGLGALLADGDARNALLAHQRKWVTANSWAAQAGRIANIMRGCFEERHGVALRAPAPSAARSAALPDRMAEGGGGALRAEDLAAAEALLKRRPGTRAEVRFGASGDGVPEPFQAAAPRIAMPDFRPAPFEGIRSRLPGLLRGHMQKRRVRHARRARAAQDWTLAALHYRLALDYRPDRAGLWVQYGHALKESGNFSAAEGAYRRALALGPDVADTHLQLGHVLKLQGHAGGAVSAYLRALAVDRHFAPALAELAALGWSASRIERALSRMPDPLSALQDGEGGTRAKGAGR